MSQNSNLTGSRARRETSTAVMTMRGPSELDNVFLDHIADIQQLTSTSSRHEKIRVDK